MMKRATMSGGYTLVEMIMVIFVATTVLLVVTGGTIIFYRTNGASLSQAYAVEGGRRGIAHAVDDIRAIQYGADGSYPIAVLLPNDFAFFSDVDGDGIPEQVEYRLSGTDFIRTTTTVSGNPPSYVTSSSFPQTMANSVKNAIANQPIFHYYDKDGAELTTISNTDPVAYVSVLLIINQKDALTAASTTEYALRSTAALRNTSQF